LLRKRLKTFWGQLVLPHPACRIMKSSLWAAPRTLVYRDKISCPWVRDTPWTRLSKRGIS